MYSCLSMVLASAALLLTASHRCVAASRTDTTTGFRESVALSIDPDVSSKFAEVRSHLANRQWLLAVRHLVQISDSASDSLVPVHPGRYCHAQLYCQMLLSGLPPEGLDAYRALIDDRAGRWFQQAEATGSHRLLKRVVQSAFASSYGDDALLLLAEQAWEDGRLSEARRWWTALLSRQESTQTDSPAAILRYPNAQIDSADVRVRLILCSLLQGAIDRAQRELKDFEKLHGDAEGTLAGQSGQLSEILEAVIADAQRWRSASQVSGSPTFAATQERSGTYPPPENPLAVAWRVDLPEDSFAARGEPAKRLARGPLSHFPVTDETNVFVNDAYSVHAFALRTGTPAWPVDGNSSGVLYRSRLAQEGRPIQPMRGTPQYTMTIHDGRLYARMGVPITRVARREFRAPNEIIGLDVARGEGKLVFHVAAGSLGPQDEAWSFDGAPVVAGERLYVAVTQNRPQVRVSIACFDTRTAELLWRSPICTSLRQPEETWNVARHGLLTLAGGQVFYTTGLGAVAAIDQTNGDVQWIVTYETQELASAHSESSESSDVSHVESGLTPCLYHAETLVVVAPDARSGMLLDATTGVLLRKFELPARVRHVLGVVRETLVVGNDSLWGIDLETAQVKWHVDNSSGGPGCGRGFVTESSVWWPTRKQLLEVDGTSGVVLRRVGLEELTRREGGNLLVAHGRLLIAQADCLVSFTDASDDRVPSRPNCPDAGNSFDKVPVEPR